ncbi:MAG: phosphopantetheine-binding protein [Bacteroidales bacterium]|nr:phosphopantetheine-binding protein [Bacteroidales bacterium]
MTKEEIFEGLLEVFKVIRPKLDPNAISPDSRLIADLGVDSLSMMLLALASEEKFNIKFSQNVFETVNDVCEYILSAKKDA